MVLVPSPRSDRSGFDTYYVRLKDGNVAESLRKLLQEAKIIA